MKVYPCSLDQSTPFFNCSSVKKMRMVVGCRRVHAGNQPLNMNIAPSFFSDVRITARVDCIIKIMVSVMEWDSRENMTDVGTRARSVHDTALLDSFLSCNFVFL
jgi:hypothetical protein